MSVINIVSSTRVREQIRPIPSFFSLRPGTDGSFSHGPAVYGIKSVFRFRVSVDFFPPPGSCATSTKRIGRTYRLSWFFESSPDPGIKSNASITRLVSAQNDFQTSTRRLGSIDVSGTTVRRFAFPNRFLFFNYEFVFDRIFSLDTRPRAD